MRFKPVDTDRMEGDNPEDMSRTARMQRRIATALIRPTSVSTGEQRQRLKDYEGRISPRDFSQSIKDDQIRTQRRDRQLTDAIGKAETYNGFIHQYENGPEDITGLRRLYAQESDKVKNLSVPLVPSQTSKHLWMAALLGKHAVGYAVSDSNPAMRKEAVSDRSRPYPQIEGPEGPTGIYEASDLGEAKAVNRANTRNLTRGQRLRARIAPYHAVVHELNDAYGGPEEGGWTYETGENVHTSRGFVTARGAAKEAERLKTKYTPAKGGRSILSMSASDVYDMDRDEGVFEPLEYTDNHAKAMGMPSRFIQEPLDEDYNYSHFGQPSRDYRVNVAYGNIDDYPKQRPRYE